MIHLVLAAAAIIEPSTTAREIIYHQAETPVIYTQLGFVTAVYLPDGETILWDKEHPLRAGIKDFFEATASGSVLYIRPMDLPRSKDPNTGGKSTDVAFDLASGNHMQFVVQEVSRTPGLQADLKVFIKEGDQSQIIAAQNAPKYVPAAALEALRQQLAEQTASVETLRKRDEGARASAALTEALTTKTDYQVFDRKGKDKIDARIWRDDRFTFVRLLGASQESPTLWELKDGKPAKVPYTLQSGTYIVQHLVDEGELSAGKSSLKFRFEKE